MAIDPTSLDVQSRCGRLPPPSRRERERAVYSTLLQADDPTLQHLALTGILDSAMDAMKRNMGYEPYLNGGGAIARIATGGISGNVLTLTNAPDAANFEVGGWVCASGDGDGSLGTETLRGGGTGAGTATG